MLPELFIRGSNFYEDRPARWIGKGPLKSYSITLEYDNPGWISFDFAADVPAESSGAIPPSTFTFYVNDKLRFKARGSYTYERVYIYVDKGKNTFLWINDKNYRDSDQSFIRMVFATEFVPIENYAIIEQASPPKPLNEISRFSIINGRDRFQQSGPKGIEIDMIVTFAPTKGEDGSITSGQENYMNFIQTFPNFYMIKYNYGLFGGTLMDPQPSSNGPITFADILFHSPQRTKEDTIVW